MTAAPTEAASVASAGTEGAAATSTPGGRFPCFDGLRAIAAIAVLVFHVVTAYNASWLYTPGWDWMLRLGNIGVCIFFLISGFLLYRPFAVAHLADRPAPELWPFWKRRAFRIFPAYWVALAFLAIVIAPNTIRSVTSFFTFVGLVQNYRAGYQIQGLGVAWTLVIEVSFYAALPFLAMAIRALPVRGGSMRARALSQMRGVVGLYVIAIAIRVIVLWTVTPAPLHRGEWFLFDRIDTWLVGYLDWFALGMLLAVGSAWVAAGGRLPWIVEWLSRYPVASWLLAIECYWVSLNLHLPLNVFSAVTRTQSLSRAIFSGLSAMFLLLPAVFGPQDRGLVRRFLRTRVMVGLGTISYGIYLYHYIFRGQVVSWTRDGTLSRNLLEWFVVLVALTLVCATISYFVVERPLIRWSHRRRPRVVAAGDGDARPDPDPVPVGSRH